MWGTFLSEPLRIVALVGRYPANKLMRRMPILDRNRFLRPAEDVLRRCRPVLVRISPGYPSVKGRLHTCYSPVRRSPAEESKLSSPLPLDLHVLSLSLAFILSQDQTLRCWLSFFIFFLFLKRSKKATSFLVCCCLHGHPVSMTARRSPAMSSSIESEELTLGSFCNDSCTTS